MREPSCIQLASLEPANDNPTKTKTRKHFKTLLVFVGNLACCYVDDTFSHHLSETSWMEELWAAAAADHGISRWLANNIVARRKHFASAPSDFWVHLDEFANSQRKLGSNFCLKPISHFNDLCCEFYFNANADENENAYENAYAILWYFCMYDNLLFVAKFVNLQV